MNNPRVPIVAIVGRPNVGKSTLFNSIARQRVAIVEATPGVTRDRLAQSVTWRKRTFTLIDTGGIGIVDEPQLAAAVERQIETAIRDADVVLFVVDILTGVHQTEKDIAVRMHRLGKRVVLVANKADSPGKTERAFEFMALGFGEPIVISAKGRRGLDSLEHAVLEAVDAVVPDAAEVPAEAADQDAESGEDEADEAFDASDFAMDEDETEAIEEPAEVMVPRITIIGRRNVGKSSLVNSLAREERVIVSSVPGTTRDAIDVLIRRGEEEFTLIDTAGLMKRKRCKGIDFYGSVRTQRSVVRADGVILMIDALQGVSRVDQHVAADVVDHYKPCVIAVSKWDLAGEVRTGEYIKYLQQELPALTFAPVVFMSVHDHEYVWSAINLMQSLLKQSRTKVQTSRLNAILQQAATKKQPRVGGSRMPKIYYGVQIGVMPPTFRIFVNETSLFSKHYRRYLVNEIRANSELAELPIKITFSSKIRNDKRFKQ